MSRRIRERKETQINTQSENVTRELKWKARQIDRCCYIHSLVRVLPSFFVFSLPPLLSLSLKHPYIHVYKIYLTFKHCIHICLNNQQHHTNQQSPLNSLTSLYVSIALFYFGTFPSLHLPEWSEILNIYSLHCILRRVLCGV